jgi:hypothetical protein
LPGTAGARFGQSFLVIVMTAVVLRRLAARSANTGMTRRSQAGFSAIRPMTSSAPMNF